MIVVYDKPKGGEPRRLYARDHIGGGGEGDVYVTNLSASKRVAVKIFNERKLQEHGDFLSQKILDMENHSDKKALVKYPMVAWPQLAVYNKNGRVVGYAMRQVKGKQLSRLAHPKLYEENFPGMDRVKVANMLIRLWESVQFLHQRQIYIGDINSDNVMCSEHYGICWIDVDSFHVGKHRCLVGRQEMTPPEHQGEDYANIDRTCESDLFSMAILTFQCMMLGRHPYDHIGGGNLLENLRKGLFPYGRGGARPGEKGGIPKGPWYKIWSHYSYDLKELFVRTFKEGVADRSKRPSAEEWKKVLTKYVNILHSPTPARREDGSEWRHSKEMIPAAEKPRDLQHRGSAPKSQLHPPNPETNMTDQADDLITNPTPRCACMLVLDVSSSMEGPKIAELNEGARQFLKEVRDDEFARYSVELGVITFGGVVETVLEFGPPEQVKWKDLPAIGNTPMGQAINAAISALEQRKSEYTENGVSYYQPWLVLMTDGMPTDHYHDAAERLRAVAAEKKMVVFGIGIGDECRMDVLAEFCPENRPPAKLTGLKFKEFFAWLSQSMSRVSQSTPGTKIDLPPTNSWGSIEP